MFVLDKKKGEMYSLPAKELGKGSVKVVGSELAQRIMHLLVKEPLYPSEIAKRLKVHEQKVYYHIRNLEKAGVVEVVKRETRQGALARYYQASQPAFVVRFKELEKTHKLGEMRNGSAFLEPFIQDGKLNAQLIVGSPDPHGPAKARSRDGYYGMDLALFLGTFLNYVPGSVVKLDTEVRESDLRDNLILIGGHIVNKVTERVNDKLPLRFTEEGIRSGISHELYPADECGLVVKTRNPFNADKSILVVAGNRFAGTRAAIIAFLKHFERLQEGNIHQPSTKACVVEGVDLDSDGIIDDVEFRE